MNKKILRAVSFTSALIPSNIRKSIRKGLVRIKLFPSFEFVQIALTYKCNNKCKRCSIKKYKTDGNELSKKEIFRIIDFLKSVRIGRLGFFGGEPMLRKDIFEIITYASKNGIRTELITNGYLLNEGNVKKLKDTGLSMVTIGLDSVDEAEHNKIHRVSDSYQNAIKAIRISVNAKLVTRINVGVTKKSLRDGGVKKIIGFAEQNGVSKVKVVPPTMVGGWINSKDKLLEEKDFKEIIILKKEHRIVASEVSEIRGKTIRKCLCKKDSRLYISPYGDVQPCWAVPVSFGNIRKDNLKDILKIKGSYTYDKSSWDCIGNDPVFRKEYLSKSHEALPLELER